MKFKQFWNFQVQQILYNLKKTLDKILGNLENLKTN